ncbi:peptidase M16 [Micrococcales bacterium 31B]|nr:peptidase M16 [Micrococcales bacterium 31B]
MKKRPIVTLLAGASLTAGLAFAAVGSSTTANAAAAADPAPIVEVTTATIPTWDEFRSGVHQDADGVFVVSGDEPIHGEAELRAFYDQLVKQAGGGTLKSSHDHGDEGHVDLLLRKTSDGQAAKWNATTARNLTYCISDDFGPLKQQMIDAMEEGAAPWEAASSGVDFRYLPEEDANCTASNDNVLFPVMPMPESGGTLARAFFPDDADRYRTVVVAPAAFESRWPLANIMGHELGHTLGFRHEHAHPDSGTCFETGNWYQLTPYDSDSIMHYPQCNGTSDVPSFSYYDGVGTRAVYGY